MADHKNQHEVVIQVPDLGLSEEQMNSLKETFKSHLVSTMGHKPNDVRTVVVVIRVQRVSQQ